MCNISIKTTHRFSMLLIIRILIFVNVTDAQEKDLPVYLRDRGTGVSTSMFGTYIRQGELLFYPFFEYYLDKNMEYKLSTSDY